MASDNGEKKLEVVKDVEEGKGDDTVVVDDHGEVRRKILSLRSKAESDSWDLSIALAEAYEKDLYRNWNFETWRDYVEQEVDINVRKAQFLVKIQKWFGTMTPSIQAWVREIGWTKARMLTSFVTQANAAEWRQRIEGKTVAQLEAMLKTEREGAGEDDGNEGGEGKDDAPERSRKRSFSLFPGQDEVVTSAVKKMKDAGVTDKDGHALTLICTDYLSDSVDVLDIQSYLKNVEMATGLKIVALKMNKNEEDEIVYGWEYTQNQGSEDAPSDKPTGKE